LQRVDLRVGLIDGELQLADEGLDRLHDVGGLRLVVGREDRRAVLRLAHDVERSLAPQDARQTQPK